MAAASSSTADVVSDFLLASVHLILRTRNVYPADIFERRRLFDVTVFHSCHVELNEYISMVVHGARWLLDRGEADALVVSILGRPRDAPPSVQPSVLERFRIDIEVDLADEDEDEPTVVELPTDR